MLENIDKKYGNSPSFGSYYVVDQIGKIEIGDEVMVLK